MVFNDDPGKSRGFHSAATAVILVRPADEDSVLIGIRRASERKVESGRWMVYAQDTSDCLISLQRNLQNGDECSPHFQ
jgi:hypothetical protein